jgi:hypothetical protein
MRRANLWNRSLSQGELDQRARDARLRLERLERLFLPLTTVTGSLLRRLLYHCSGVFARASRESRPRGPLSNPRPSRTPTIHDIWVEECGSLCRASADLALCRPSG